jgi:type I restriction enzyme S subunit
LPDRQYCDNGDLLFAWSASFGPYIWAGERAIYHYHIWKVRLSPAISLRFMFYLLGDLTHEVKAQSHGLAMLHMTKAKMESWPILVPPLAEQHRIVAKVDALMALCDTLEARLTEAQALHAAFAAAAVHHLDV